MNSPHRAAILGLGAMGDVMVRAFSANREWRVVAVADPSPAARARAKDLAPAAEAIADADGMLDPAMIARLGIDLVAIATPPETHMPLAVAALEAGCHVLCEKPMARDVAEAEQMVRASESRPGLIAIVDHQLRFTRSRRWLRDRLRAGELGTPRQVEVQTAVPRLVGSRWSWWSRRDAGGGMLNEFGSHAVDLLSWLFGPPRDAAGVLRTAIASRPDADGIERPVDSDDLASFRLTWDGGLFADVRLSGLSLPPERYLRVHGDTGTIELDADDQATWHRRDGSSERFDLAETEPSLIDSPTDSFSQPFARLVGLLGEGLASGTSPADATSFADGLSVVRILDAVRGSAGVPPTEVTKEP